MVSHHFSSFVLSRRAVRPHVHGRHDVVARAHTHGHVLSCRAARRTLATRWLSRQTVSNAIAIYLGGAIGLRSIVALQCASLHCSVLQKYCKTLQCSVNHLYRGRSSPAFLGLSVPGHQGLKCLGFIVVIYAYDLGSGSSSSEVDAEARFASLALVGPRNWVVGVTRPPREHLELRLAMKTKSVNKVLSLTCG